ncbi:MAG: carboxypeptidase regulatory-like domain-containing protein, partial [Acidimicrobiia bacterium]
TTQPAADVDVVLAQTPGAGASPGTQLSFSPTTVHFTPENWNVPQSVGVSALDDDTTESNPHEAIISGVATSADPIFDGQAPTATVTIQELSPTLGVVATPATASGIDGFSTTWSFTFSNNGPGDASNAAVEVTVPTGSPGFTVVGSPSMDNGFGCATSSNPGTTVYSCTRAAQLMNGEAATFALATTANGSPGDTPTITAVGTADATVVTPASTATAVATIGTPIFNLRVTNAPDLGQQEPGGPVTWTATVENTSTDGEDATGVVATFALPAGVDLAGAPTMPGYACLPGSGSGPLTITCSGGPDLPVTQPVSMSVPTTVSAPVGSSPTTTAAAMADQTDTDPSDDSADAAVTIAAIADLVTTKTVSKGSVDSGDAVTWYVTVTNTSSTTPATWVDINDDLPPGLTPVNLVAPAGFACTISPSGVRCTAPSLAAGASAELRFDTIVSGKKGSDYTNTAAAKSANDPDTDNNVAKASVGIANGTGSIAGTVTDLTSGDPLGGIEVRVFDAAMREFGGVVTNPDGTYELGGIEPGDYLVRFHDPSGTYGQQWFDHVAPLSAASTVTVEAGARVGATDAALAAGTQISGTVTSESTGLPLEGICVEAYDADAPTFNDGAATTVTTAPDGTYSLTGLASTPYIVLFRDCSKTPVYALELYDGGSGTVDPAQATKLTPTGSGLDDVDAALGTGGSISGAVYQLPAHTPVEKGCVIVLNPGFGLLAMAFTGADGTYQLNGVPEGNWYVAAGECDSGDGDGEFVWYAGATSVAVTSTEVDVDPVADGAAVVAVVASANTSGINLYFGALDETAPVDPPTSSDPSKLGAEPTAANTAASNPVSGSLPRTGVPGPDMAILGGLLLGVGLLVVRVTELRRAR